MKAMGAPMDEYTLKARYLPALIVVLPLWLAFAVWFPPDKQFTGVFASAGMTLVFGTLLAQLGRDAGKRRQKELFEEWGGPPTTRALAYCTRVVNHVTLARCHAALRKLVPGLALPADEAAERVDWDAARQGYESACDYLRGATRDKDKFKLVYAENVNFGFRRNLWAMKPTGIGLTIIAMVCVGVHAWLSCQHGEQVSGLEAASMVLCVALLILWALRFTRQWVRLAADEYSSHLVAAAAELGRDPKASPKA